MTSLSFKSKLLVMLLSVSAISIALVASLNYAKSYEALRESVFSHLTSVRATKAAQLEQNIARLSAEIRVLGSAAGIAMAARDFSRAMQALDDVEVTPAQQQALEAFYVDTFMPKLAAMVEGTPELGAIFPDSNAARVLQYHYLAANPYPDGERQQLDAAADDDSEYTRLHATHHPVLRRIANGFSYRDLFLIDIDTGLIVYSTDKEIDFATSLNTGPHSRSNLARLFREVQRVPDRGAVQIADFEHYRPSHGAPAAFFAVPVFDKNRPVAVLAVQRSTAQINMVMTGDGNWDRDGLGKTGETILVGPDYLMRSASRFLIEDPDGFAADLRAAAKPEMGIKRMLALGSPILEHEVRTVAAEQALQGKAGTGIIDDYRGVEILGSWGPLKLADLDWAIVAKVDLSEAYAPIHKLARATLIQSVIILGAITLVVMLLANSFVRPVHELIARVRRFGAGDLDVDFGADSQDEIGDLSRAFRDLVESARKQSHLIEQISGDNDRLIENLLPQRIAQRVKRGDGELLETITDVSVIFVEARGLAEATHQRSADESLKILKGVIAAADGVAKAHDVERIKTMGDTYMAAVGLSRPILDHMRRSVEFARDLQAALCRLGNELDLDFKPMIGIASGPVVTDVVQDEELLFHLWGEAVIQADHARDRAQAGEIVVTATIHDKLADAYEFKPLGDDGHVPLWAIQRS